MILENVKKKRHQQKKARFSSFFTLYEIFMLVFSTKSWGVVHKCSARLSVCQQLST